MDGRNGQTMARGPYMAISFLILAAKLETTIVAHQSKRLPTPGIDRQSTGDSVTFQIVFYDLKILQPVIKGHLFALFRLINQSSSYGNTPLFSFEKQHLQCVDGTASSPHCLLRQSSGDLLSHHFVATTHWCQCQHSLKDKPRVFVACHF